MLPSVSPLTSSPKKRLQFTGSKRSHERVRPTRSRGPHSVQLSCRELPDPDEHSVHRVVDAERLLDHVAVPVEADGKTQERLALRDLRRPDLRAHLGAAGRPVLTRTVDRGGDDLCGDVGRGAEQLTSSAVELLERLDAL